MKESGIPSPQQAKLEDPLWSLGKTEMQRVETRDRELVVAIELGPERMSGPS